MYGKDTLCFYISKAGNAFWATYIFSLENSTNTEQSVKNGKPLDQRSIQLFAAPLVCLLN